MDQLPGQLVSAREAARILGVSVQVLAVYRRLRRIGAVRYSTRKWMFELSEIERFIASRRVKELSDVAS